MDAHSKSVFTLYRDVVKYLIHHSQSLDVLSVCFSSRSIEHHMGYLDWLRPRVSSVPYLMDVEPYSISVLEEYYRRILAPFFRESDKSENRPFIALRNTKIEEAELSTILAEMNEKHLLTGLGNTKTAESEVDKLPIGVRDTTPRIKPTPSEEIMDLKFDRLLQWAKKHRIHHVAEPCLPSWIPDWTTKRDIDEYLLLNANAKSIYK